MQERTSAYVVSFLPGCKAEVQNLKILLHDPANHGNVWVMAKITGFHHTAIRSADFDLSVKFYTEVLGLVPKITWGEAPKRAVMIDAGDGNYVEIFERDVFESGESPILHFAFRTDDCAGMLENARAAGAEVTMETTEVTIASNQGPVPVRIAFFKGPDGEIIELFENSIL